MPLFPARERILPRGVKVFLHNRYVRLRSAPQENASRRSSSLIAKLNLTTSMKTRIIITLLYESATHSELAHSEMIALLFTEKEYFIQHRTIRTCVSSIHLSSYIVSRTLWALGELQFRVASKAATSGTSRRLLPLCRPVFSAIFI